MILHYERLSRCPTVFKAMTGLTVPQVDDLVTDLLPRYRHAEQLRRTRPIARASAFRAAYAFSTRPLRVPHPRPKY